MTRPVALKREMLLEKNEKRCLAKSPMEVWSSEAVLEMIQKNHL